MDSKGLPARPLGKTGVSATIFGLGGEGILRTYGYDQQARDVIRAALGEGVTYFDSARAYAGSERYYGAALGEARDSIFLTSKSHDRTKRGALAMLDETLSNMRVSHLDLWQLHDLRTWEELSEISAPGGAYEAFVEAKRAGKTRFIGVTGHYDPEVLLAAIERLRFDTVLIPVNPCETQAAAFASVVGSRANELGMGVIGMKIYGRGLLTRQVDGPTQNAPAISELFRYALSQTADLAIIGCDSIEQVLENARAARQFMPMSETEQRALEERLRPRATETLYYRPPAAPAL